MRFRFCWDCDCPDWLLAEILTLSKIKPPSLKEFSSLVCKSICEGNLDLERIRQILLDTDFDESTIQASTAALRWILSNAGGVLIEEQVLDSELQQLGLPKEQSEAIKITFREQKDLLRDALRVQTLKASGNVNWSLDIKGLPIGTLKEPVVQLNLEGDILDQNKGYRTQSTLSKAEQTSMYLSQQQLGALIHELQDAYKHMNELKPDILGSES